MDTYPVAATRSACSSEGSPLGTVATGIGEILAMRVGCWQAPVNVGVDLQIAS
jgi:hypothetical protein